MTTKTKPTKLEVLTEVREDKLVLKFKETCENVASQVSIPRLLKEASTLHMTRTGRDLHKQAISPTKLYEARLKDLSNRARLVEIRVSLTRQRAILESALSSIRKHVLTKHGDALKAVGSTAEMRKAMLDRTLTGGLQLISDISAAIEELDQYIKDLDSAAFGFKDAIELVKLMTERHSQVV